MIFINNDDYLLLKDINYSLNLSCLLLENLNVKKDNILENIRIYKKYINLISNLLNEKSKLKFIDKFKAKNSFVLCDFFHLNKWFYVKIINKNIAFNMRRIILSNGSYQNASDDIKLLTKYYLTIETNLLNSFKKNRI